MSIARALRMMADAGLTIDQAADILAEVEHKTSGAARQARYRERKNARDVTSDVTSDAKGSEQKVSTPSKTQPPKTPLSPPKGGSSPPRIGKRIASDWKPSDIDRAYAAKQGLPDELIDRIAERFRNFWIAKTGSNATKLDWPATWRNWVLEEADKANRRSPFGEPTAAERALADRQEARRLVLAQMEADEADAN